VIITEDQRVIAGRYRLTAPIGSGGAGVVWRARDMLLDREVAVKEIVRFAAAGRDAPDETYQRTLCEARAAARIRHRGVAAVYDVISEAGCPHIVMELIEGRSLAQVIEEEGPLALSRAAHIGRQVLAALTAGHAAGVLHRDLKPANVLVTPSCRAVLTDFGVASVTGTASMTQTGIVLGTPSYLAPERAQGQAATPAADMWSLGALLYAVVSGQGPYDGYDGAVATLAAIVTQDPPGLAVGGPVSGIIRALLNRDPRRRPGAAETALVLDEAADGFPPDEPARSTAPVYEPPPAEPPATAAAPQERMAVTEPSAAKLAEVPVTEARPEEDQLVTAPLVTAALVTAPSDTTRQAPGPRTVPPELSPGPSIARRNRSRSRRRRRTILVAGAAAVTAAALIATTLTFLNGSAHPSAAHPSAAHADAALAGAPSPVPAVQEEFRVAAALNADGSPEVFARARNGTLMADHFVYGSWSGWTNLPGGHVFTGVPAVARSHDGRLVVVARTASGKLAYLWQAAPGSGSWDGPVALGLRLTSSDPAVIAGPGGHLEVFARLSDDTLGTASQLGATATSRWSGWASLGGKLAGPPVVAVNSDGDPEVFALGTDASLVHDYFDNGSWQHWGALPGGRVFTGVPSVGTNFDGRLEVFARTSSGGLEHVWQLPGGPGRWGGPLVLINGIVSDPAVYNTVGGRIEAFAVAPDGSVVHTWQDQVKAGTGWSPPASIGGDSRGVPVPVRTGGQSEVFVRMSGGTIAWDRQAASLNWSGWSGLGGSF
jgi:hypothetical protein